MIGAGGGPPGHKNGLRGGPGGSGGGPGGPRGPGGAGPRKFRISEGDQLDRGQVNRLYGTRDEGPDPRWRLAGYAFYRNEIGHGTSK